MPRAAQISRARRHGTSTTGCYATVAGCQMIVSWNFRHIVHYQKIALSNAINVVEGYSEIRIHSPMEVISHDGEDV